MLENNIKTYPGLDPIDSLLSSGQKPTSFWVPKCESCGKEYHRYCLNNLPTKYAKLCDECVKKQVESDLKCDSTRKETLLSFVRDENGRNTAYEFLSREQLDEAYELLNKENKELEHKKYQDEVREMYAKAIQSGKPTDLEFYALLLERIDEKIAENSYKADPRNIVFG